MKEYILNVDNGKLFLPHEVAHKLQGKTLVLTGLGDYIEVRVKIKDQGIDDSFGVKKELLELLMNSETETIQKTWHTPDKRENLSGTDEILECPKKVGWTQSCNQRDIRRLLYLGTYDIELEGTTLFLPGKYAELYGKRYSRVSVRVYDDRMEIRDI